MPPDGGSRATRCSKGAASSGRRGERRPRDHRHRAVGEARHDRLEPGPPARRVGDRDEHGLAAREEVAGDTGKALAAAVLDDPVGGGRIDRCKPSARASRISSQNGPSSPSTSSSPGWVGTQRPQDHTRLHDPVPAVPLEPERDVVGLLLAGARSRGGVRNATPASALPRRGQREAGVLLLLSHRRHVARSGPPAPAASAAGCPCRTGGGARGPRRGRGRGRRPAPPRPRARPGSGPRARARRPRARRARAGTPRSRARRARIRRPSCDRRSAPGAPSRRRAPRGGRTRRCCGRSRARCRRPGRSRRRAGASARPGARPRCRSRPGASPPPRPRSARR